MGLKINVDFEELLIAFEQSNVSNHFFIDVENDCIVNINENIELDAEEKLEKIIADEKYIPIPARLPQDDKNLMELFAYEFDTFDQVEEFMNALKSRKPFRNFKALLDKYGLRDKWYAYKSRKIKNEVINWLVENDITLAGQEEKILKKIEIKELTPEEKDKLDMEIKAFSPIRCLKCGCGGRFEKRIFSVNIEPENRLDEIQIAEIMKNEFRIKNFGVFTGRGCYLTVSICPRCNSEDIFWDY